MLDHTFSLPGRGLAGRLATRLVNYQPLLALRRMLMSRLPFTTLASDVRNVIYLNWVVPTERITSLLPAGIEPLSVNGNSILTVLTYSHGHFGPSLAGPLRRLFPSPLQSNWRTYVGRVHGQVPSSPTVFFLRNLFDSKLHAVCARLASDALPSHVAQPFEHNAVADRYSTRIESGSGSMNELTSETVRALATLPDRFAPFFDSWTRAVAGLCLQDSAMVAVPAIGRIAHSGIDLPIRVDEVVPLESVEYVPGPLLHALGADATPFCFCVPRVRFRVLWETLV